MAEKTKKIETSLEQPQKKAKKAKPKKNKDTDFTHANQYLLDPRQLKCWEFYINPTSETWGNAYRSAVAAGYTKANATQITTEKWWLERIRRINLLSKAEQVLNETLELKHIVPAMGAFGPILNKEKKPIMVVSPVLLRIKQDSAKFIAETQGKKNGYTKKMEVEVDPGEKLSSLFNESQLQTIARGLLNGGLPSAA